MVQNKPPLSPATTTTWVLLIGKMELKINSKFDDGSI